MVVIERSSDPAAQTRISPGRMPAVVLLDATAKVHRALESRSAPPKTVLAIRG
jgi:hypothetical protein